MIMSLMWKNCCQLTRLWDAICHLHFLHSHMDFFPENFDAVPDEHGKQFHQDSLSSRRDFQGSGMQACWQYTASHWYKKLLLQDTKGKQAADKSTLI